MEEADSAGVLSEETRTQIASYPPPVRRLFELGFDGQWEPQEWQEYGESFGIRAEHASELIRLMRDWKRFWELPGPDADGLANEAYAPMHAWRALAQLKIIEAARPMLEVLEAMDEGGAHDDIPNALSLLGPSAMPVIVEVLQSQDFGEWTRVTAKDALVHIAERHPDTKPAVIDTLIATLRCHAENPESLNGLLVNDLVEFKALEAVPIMREAYKAGTVDESIRGYWSEVREAMGIARDPDDPPDRLRTYRSVAARPMALPFSQPAQPARNKLKQQKKEKNKRKQAKKAKRQNRRR